MRSEEMQIDVDTWDAHKSPAAIKCAIPIVEHYIQ